MKALYFIFPLGSLCFSDVYRHESGRLLHSALVFNIFLIKILIIYLFYFQFGLHSIELHNSPWSHSSLKYLFRNLTLCFLVATGWFERWRMHLAPPVLVFSSLEILALENLLSYCSLLITVALDVEGIPHTSRIHMCAMERTGQQAPRAFTVKLI